MRSVLTQVGRAIARFLESNQEGVRREDLFVQVMAEVLRHLAPSFVLVVVVVVAVLLVLLLPDGTLESCRRVKLCLETSYTQQMSHFFRARACVCVCVPERRSRRDLAPLLPDPCPE